MAIINEAMLSQDFAFAQYEMQSVARQASFLTLESSTSDMLFAASANNFNTYWLGNVALRKAEATSEDLTALHTHMMAIREILRKYNTDISK